MKYLDKNNKKEKINGYYIYAKKKIGLIRGKENIKKNDLIKAITESSHILFFFLLNLIYFNWFK